MYDNTFNYSYYFKLYLCIILSPSYSTRCFLSQRFIFLMNIFVEQYIPNNHKHYDLIYGLIVSAQVTNENHSHIKKKKKFLLLMLQSVSCYQ